MLYFLPKDLKYFFDSININLITEIRLRCNCPIEVEYKGEKKFLTNSGLALNSINAVKCKQSDINFILQSVSNNSLYSINDQLINGYITLKNGIRIGVCGEVVYINNQIKTIKNISSINIRIPHFIKNISLKVLHLLLYKNMCLNTLIVSPAGAGKTTFLRDISIQLRNQNPSLNILIADERSEITTCFDDNVFYGFDIYKNCSKKFAFENGIRSMKPNVIITDELNFSNDLESIQYASTCGVNIVASIHANSLNDLRLKPYFEKIYQNKVFSRYILLGFSNGVGTIEGVFDENFNFIG